MLIAATAAGALPEEVPAFFRGGGTAIASGAIAPDVFKEGSLRALNSAESPEHYIDLEYLEGKELPATRYGFLQLCNQMKLRPDRVGTLPYAITEWTQRLTVAFAEHRRWPEDRAVRAKCLVYAGILAHYSGDAAMPLHTTVDFDGRADEKGKSPRSGIHEKIDALPGRMVRPIDAKPAEGRVRAYGELPKGVMAEIERSHALVDACYGMEKEFPAEDAKEVPERVEAFCAERVRAGSAFTASLFLTAWRDSEKFEVPEWVIKAHEAPATQPPAP